MNQRPRFKSADDWFDAYERATREGWRPWEPASHDEFVMADRLGLFEIYPEWKPHNRWLPMLGLPADFGQPVEPLTEHWQERFLATLLTDSEFTMAVGLAIEKVQQ